MQRFAWCVSLIVVVAACSSPSRAPTAGPTTTRAGDSTSTSLRLPPTSGLRGVPVRNFECPHPAVSAGGSPVPIGAVQTFLLCPLGTPGQPAELPQMVTLGANQPVFEDLMRALSAADEPPVTGAVCPAYADLTQVVLAQTSDHTYQVSIPTDACKHYQHDALTALQRARAT